MAPARTPSGAEAAEGMTSALTPSGTKAAAEGRGCCRRHCIALALAGTPSGTEAAAGGIVSARPPSGTEAAAGGIASARTLSGTEAAAGGIASARPLSGTEAAAGGIASARTPSGTEAAARGHCIGTDAEWHRGCCRRHCMGTDAEWHRCGGKHCIGTRLSVTLAALKGLAHLCLPSLANRIDQVRRPFRPQEGSKSSRGCVIHRAPSRLPTHLMNGFVQFPRRHKGSSRLLANMTHRPLVKVSFECPNSFSLRPGPQRRTPYVIVRLWGVIAWCCRLLQKEQGLRLLKDMRRCLDHCHQQKGSQEEHRIIIIITTACSAGDSPSLPNRPTPNLSRT